MLRKEQNTAQKAKNNAVILLSGEEKPQSANVGMLGETFYVSSIPSEHNKKIVNEQWQNAKPSPAISKSQAVPPMIAYCSSYPRNQSLKLLIPLTIG